MKEFYLNCNPGIDRIRAYFWTKVVSMNFMSSFRKKLGPHRFGRWARKILFPPQMRPGYDFFNFYLNNEQAYFIASLRTNGHSCTQRYLSEIWAKRYPKTNVVGGDQYDGRWLAEYAADYLDNPEIAG